VGDTCGTDFEKSLKESVHKYNESLTHSAIRVSVKSCEMVRGTLHDFMSSSNFSRNSVVKTSHMYSGRAWVHCTV